MEFHNLYRHGFVRVAAATLPISMVQPEANANAILEQARELAVDLLVVGSHTHQAKEGASMGRTAARVLQLSEVPVYMVPMMQKRGRG